MINLLIISDLHLRYDVPDIVNMNQIEWINAQFRIIDEIYNIARDKGLHLAILGDIFNRSKEDITIANLFLDKINRNYDNYGISTYIICGNHDLLFHSEEKIDNSLIGIIYSLTKKRNSGIFPLWEIGIARNFGGKFRGKGKLLFDHKYKNKNDDFTDYIDKGVEFIFLGDNHIFWNNEINGVKIYNIGCLIPQRADEVKIRYIPKFIIFRNNKVEINDFPIFDYIKYYNKTEGEKRGGKDIVIEISDYISNQKTENLGLDFPSFYKKEISKIENNKVKDYLLNIYEEEFNDR